MNPKEIIVQFHELWYNMSDSTWGNMTWMGVPCFKNPMDMWIVQELITELRPTAIIETGTFQGGSALFYAHMTDLLNLDTIIITIDKVIHNFRPKHPRILYFKRDSVDPEFISDCKTFLDEKNRWNKILLILDSDHTTEHVHKELSLYSQLDPVYIIVEDTNVTGPANAVTLFLSENNNYVIDRCREKFLFTFNPKGFLKRRQYGI